MVELNHRQRTIKIKIVYYGPPVGGKTTNLQVLHQHADTQRRGELVSINSAQDRTILFDLLPLKVPGFRGFDLRLQVLTVPGQAMYAATRRLVLKGADSVVFVANSAADRWDENVQSFREMTENLLIHQLDPTSLPLVLQYNKRDLPETTPIEFMDRALNARKVDALPAVAKTGQGVLETFAAVLARTVYDLAVRYQIVDVGRGQPLQQWTRQAMLGMFGATSLTEEAPLWETAGGPSLVSAARKLADAPVEPAAAARLPARPAPGALPPEVAPAVRASPAVTAPAAAPAPIPVPPLVSSIARDTAAPAPAPTAPEPRPGHRPMPPPLVLPALLDRSVLRLDPVFEAQHLGPEARAQETLVESYAQASARLAEDMAELREERDLARRRLDDLRQTLLAAQDVVAGQPLETTLRSVLEQMALGAGARHASLLVPGPTGAFHAALLRGLEQDPLLRLPPGVRHVTDQFRHEAEPRLHQAQDSLDLGEALQGAIPPFDALVAVPLRTTHGLQALALFYYSAEDVRPRTDILEHLALIAGTLSSALELASATAALQQDDQLRQLGLVGAASMRGLEEVLAPLLLFRDRLGVLRRRADAPTWLQKECDRLIPTLSRALGQSRSLLGFGRGDIQREIVNVDELLGDQQAQGLDVRAAPGLALWGDPALLRLTLAALVERLQDAKRGPVRLVLDSVGGRVKVRIGPGAAPLFCREASLLFVHRVLELHQSELATESDASGTWFCFSIAAA